MNHGDRQEQLQELTYDEKTFDDVHAERASLRSWLYEAVPTLDDSPYGAPDKVQRSINETIEEVAPDEFDPDELVGRIEETLSSRANPRRIRGH